MKKVSVILLTFFSIVYSAQATDYYFSSSTGSDANNGTIGSPYQTIGKVNTILNSAAGGDRILLKRGDTFNGAITTTKAGTSAASITIGAYGTGAKPVINGFITASGWTLIDAAKGIYESSALATSATLNMVTINGVEYAKGRYPNIDNGNDGYLNYESHTSNSITDNGSTIDATWIGSTIAIRTNHATMDMDTITNVSGKTITFNTTNIAYAISTDNYGYFIEDDIKTLDQFGEWYYNPDTKKIDVCFLNNNPALFTVQVSAYDKLLRPISYVTIRDINFTGANMYALHNDWAGTTDVDIINCSFNYSGIDAICISLKTNLTIDSCTFNYTNSNAISVGDRNVNTIVSNCTITNTGTFQGMLLKDDRRVYGYGIYSFSPPNMLGLTFVNNVIKKTGYSGVYFAGDNNLIQNNFVDSTCMWLDDGGGIYTFQYAKVTAPVDNINNRILYNIVDHTLGAPKGTEGAIMAQAYYFDDNTNHITFIGNTGCNSGYSGLFVHNTFNYLVQNNVFYGNKGAQIYWQDDGSAGNILYGDMQGNQAFATTSSQYVFYAASLDNNFGSFAFSDNNFYCSPFKENQIGYTNWFGHTTNYYDLTGWQNTFQKDLNTQKTPIAVTDINNVLFKYNVTNSPLSITLDGTYIELDHTIHNTGKIIIEPFTSVILIKISSTIPKRIKYNPFRGKFKK